jgi:hypothetical protein
VADTACDGDGDDDGDGNDDCGDDVKCAWDGPGTTSLRYAWPVVEVEVEAEQRVAGPPWVTA